MAKVLMVIAPKDFRDEELFQTKEEIEKKAEVKIASLSRETARGMLGGEAQPDITLDEVKPAEYDALVFVGGVGAKVYFNDEKALSLAKAFASAGKIVAAICIAPVILANASLLRDKRATCYESVKDSIPSYTGKHVEKDGNIITADGPGSAREFGSAIREAL